MLSKYKEINQGIIERKTKTSKMDLTGLKICSITFFLIKDFFIATKGASYSFKNCFKLVKEEEGERENIRKATLSFILNFPFSYLISHSLSLSLPFPFLTFQHIVFLWPTIPVKYDISFFLFYQDLQR